MSSSQGLKSRGIAFLVNFTVAERYNNWYKPLVYDMMGVNESSSPTEKRKANRVAFATHQIPLYAGILYAAGVPPEQIPMALTAGVSVGIVIADRFQQVMNYLKEIVDKKFYAAKEKTDHFKSFGKLYARNLALATCIAACVRIGFSGGAGYADGAREFMENPDKYLQVIDIGTENWTYVKNEDFDESRHFLISSKDLPKVKGKSSRNIIVF